MTIKIQITNIAPNDNSIAPMRAVIVETHQETPTGQKVEKAERVEKIEKVGREELKPGESGDFWVHPRQFIQVVEKT